MIIIIHSVPREKIRCDQAGDWAYAKDVISVSVPDDMRPDHQLCLGIHELIEAYLCQKNKITDEQVCAHDTMFEEERKNGKWKDEEPGDDPRSPYRAEHELASYVENCVGVALHISKKAYERDINK